MASILDLIKHYQHSIEKYPNDEQKVLKCIDKLYNLGVTVQHLQETGVGRTVNALRKEPGDVGQAARALVYKWKVMVAAEESDQEENIDDDTTNHNGYDNRRDYDSNPSESRNRHDKQEKYDRKQKTEEKHHTQSNGDHSGNKRKYHSSEEEDHDIKKVKHSSTKDNKYTKPEVRVKQEPSDSEIDSQDDTSSESDSEGSQSSEEERKPDIKVKVEKIEKTERHGSSSTKQSSRSNNDAHKYESSSESGQERYKNNTSETKHSSEKSSYHKPNNSDSHKSSKEVDMSIVKKEKEYRLEKERSHSEDSSNRHKSRKEPEQQKTSSSLEKHKHSSSSEKHKSSGSSEKHKSSSSSEKHKSSSSSEKHKSSSSSEKYKSSSSSEKHKSSSSEKHRTQPEKSSSSTDKHSSSKSDKDKYKSSSEKEISSDKHKSKEISASSSSSKDKHSSSSKEKSKDKSSSSKEKESSHKSDKKHSSSYDAAVKTSDSKRKSDSNHDEASSKKSKHKSSSSSSSKSSSKSKDDIPKTKSKTNGEHVNSDDGIDCGSGASFAEALGMISPAKSKKKSFTRDSTQSPNSCNEDLSPATLLAPTAKLAPLPALEISALPEISPNYRPRPPPKCLPHFTDEHAMSAAISSKNQRTKVYSGNKVMGKITSLYEMCVQILQEHIDALEYTGGVPYEILKPVVDKATPQQLFMLEHYNPYLMEDTDHLWQKFCEKSFRNKKRQEYESWREMYIRCQEEQEIRLKSLTNNIKIAQEAKKAPIKQTKMAYVDSVVKPPRNILKKQAQHGTAFAATASPAARVAALAAAPNVLKGGRAAPAPVLTPSSSALKPKKAPLMQKALQFMRGRKR
ncbi:transcription elongation factor B polypeptide 3 [Bicyclus anynana]|uniref:Transcription elongation factor B polypeptide 3 n=1 Tax=Bicyclus anynana TaxID=110368 RepID=A0ABM3LKY6_BICAN|nr:transcription elongation factor B polypeptide 3 [Bicyclus anynana]